MFLGVECVCSKYSTALNFTRRKKVLTCDNECIEDIATFNALAKN